MPKTVGKIREPWLTWKVHYTVQPIILIRFHPATLALPCPAISLSLYTHIHKKKKMKLSFVAMALAAAYGASAGVVITPVFLNQVVAKVKGDCAFGEVTPHGCG